MTLISTLISPEPARENPIPRPDYDRGSYSPIMIPRGSGDQGAEIRVALTDSGGKEPGRRQVPLLQGPLAGFADAHGYQVEVRWHQATARLHVHSLHPGHDAALRVTFPYALRVRHGQRYLVEHLRPVRPASHNSAHYHGSGRIWEMVDGRAGQEVTPARPNQRRKRAR
jgi:hypothetical protein